MNLLMVNKVDDEVVIIVIGDGGHIIPSGCRGSDWGWLPEPYLEFTRAVGMLKDALQLKTPGVQDETIKALHGFVQQQLAENFSEHMSQGAVLVL